MRDQKMKIRNFRIRDFEVTDGKVLPTNVKKSNGNDKENNINRLRNVLKAYGDIAPYYPYPHFH
jgi:hypothetical protein